VPEEKQIDRGQPPAPPPDSGVRATLPPLGKSNKRIVWDHFTDTVWLIALELVLYFGLDRIGPYAGGSVELLLTVRVFSKWFVVAALSQFVIESSLDLAAKDVDLLHTILKRKGRRDEEG
jgi:hypothetical protein